ncbi:Type-1 restriction enzyme EcoKI specificity protein [Pontiella desulfatans]|uniref:Type-1 restriction enzyme EcoKI specificity protein n=1 Tax=Pontiella desulfatans TaxID=2750659 RepID=A0A6C2UEW8_PONDE|nr:restriction endonuclease subunit S [Pontiella desulfatans]VGO17756.1 Type-1 restriction enzyme EcoKI specificity protein [Pontiella desulfatans]
MSASKGWKTERLGDVAKTSSGGTPKRGVTDYYGGDIPWVKSGELGDGTVYDVQETITQSGLDNSSAKLFPKGTLCIALYGATIGKLGILGVDATTNQAVCGIFLPEDIDTQYVFYFLESIRKDLINQGKGGAQPNINQGIIRDIQLPMPGTLDEQRRIVAEIEKQFTRLDAGVEGLKRVQANLKRYRASVLKAACEGKLVPTEAELCGADLTTETQRLGENGRDASPQASDQSHRFGREDGLATKRHKKHKDGESENLCDLSDSARDKYEFETGSELLERILIERRKAHEEQQKNAPLNPPSPRLRRTKKKYKEPAAPDTKDLPDLPEGWVWATAEQLTTLLTSGSRGWGKYYADKGSLFIRAQDIKTDSLNLSGVAHVSLPEKAEGMRSSVENNDLLVTITGANVTKSAMVKGLDEVAYVSQHVALLKPVRNETSPFQFVWIVSPAHGRNRLEKWAYGAGKPGLSLEQVRSLPLGLPPLAEQKRIVEEVERRLSVIEEMEAAVEANLKRAARLRQSILKKAFEGKLVK